MPSIPHRPAAKDAKKRKPLSRQRVLTTALSFADNSGTEALSMRKLGELLNVEAMSLYRHVANKDDILDGIVDLVAGEIDLPPETGDWKAAMRVRSISAHQVLMRHPWATMLVVSRVNVGPCMLRYIDASIGCLRRAGFSYADADHAMAAVDGYVYGFTLSRLNFPLHPKEYATAAQAFLPQIPASVYPHIHSLAVEVIEGRHDGMNHLEFGLDLILDGLDGKRKPRRSSGRSPGRSSGRSPGRSPKT
jgi:AcrR family transcriptional regulator